MIGGGTRTLTPRPTRPASPAPKGTGTSIKALSLSVYQYCNCVQLQRSLTTEQRTINASAGVKPLLRQPLNEPHSYQSGFTLGWYNENIVSKKSPPVATSVVEERGLGHLKLN